MSKEENSDNATAKDFPFLNKIEKGRQQADDGQTVPHMTVRERMAKYT